MAPPRSSSRSRRWQGDTLSPTRPARSVTLSRPSSWSAARIFRSITSTELILPTDALSREIVSSTFGLVGVNFKSNVASPGDDSMALDPVLVFWGICSLLIIVPGADWAFVISAGLGGRSVVPAVGGLVLGYTALTAVVAAGVGALVARSPVLLTALTVAGGAYLVWRGAMTLATPAPALDRVPATSPGTAGPILARGLGVSGLNPKGLLLFLAL